GCGAAGGRVEKIAIYGGGGRLLLRIRVENCVLLGKRQVDRGTERHSVSAEEIERLLEALGNSREAEGPPLEPDLRPCRRFFRVGFAGSLRHDEALEFYCCFGDVFAGVCRVEDEIHRQL